MRYLLLIAAFLLPMGILAQDKLFFSNGQVKKGIVVSIAKDMVLFRASDTSVIQKIKKSELLMIENYRGVRYIFGQGAGTPNAENLGDTVKKRLTAKYNYLGVQPLAIFIGRATFVYERYTKNNKIGFVLPLSITFDPFGSLYNSRIDTNRNSVKRISGVNFIGGLDVNFYLGENDHSRFFIGPRVRYGTDMFLRGIEAYSLQTQVGWELAGERGVFIQHFSLGFGFARILSSPLGTLINPQQSYAWYSLNYRLGIRW